MQGYDTQIADVILVAVIIVAGLVLAVHRRAPRRDAGDAARHEPKESQPDPPVGRVSQEGHAPPALLAAWIQFLKADLGDAVNALHNRLNVIRLATGMDDRNLTTSQKSKLEQIRTEVDRATKITTGLLRRVTSMAPNTKPPILADYEGASSRPARILLVENDDANRNVIAELFGRLGHVVTAVSNGIDAYASLQQGEVDCVICDLRLPFADGRTVFEQVEENLPHLASRFVFVTGDYTDPEARMFLERTGQPFIGKPYEVETLVSAVAQTVNRVGVIGTRGVEEAKREAEGDR